jgi:glycosyltransferase involved in cell wall biosynthesis
MVRAGISVHAMNQRGGLQSLAALLRLRREVRAFAPDVISGWLYVPSLLASWLAWSCRIRPAVLWHIRSLPFQRPLKKPSRFLVQQALALLSRLGRPGLVSNSSAARDAHTAIGFVDRGAGWTVISNGIDASTYFPNRDEASAVRAELGIPVDALVVGCVGRVVPEKGYGDMFSALATVLRRSPDLAARVHLVVIGNGAEMENTPFYEMARQILTPERMRLLGKRHDVPRLLRAFDAFVLPSRSESFPNALVEAMASGIACVCTDAGQSGEVLGMPEFVARSGDADDLAEALDRLLKLDPASLRCIGERNRRLVSESFGLDVMVSKFDALFRDAAMARQPGT